MTRQHLREHSPKPPRVSAGKARYLEWLRVADVFPDWKFGDWLKNRKRVKEALRDAD